MAGLGGKNWGFQEEVTSSDVNGFLADQVVMRFANAAARDAGFGGSGEPTLAEGMVCYLNSTNEVQVYTGSAWVSIADTDADSFSAWKSWTPALTASTTNPTLGTGSIATGRYQVIGKTVCAQFAIKFGTSGINRGSGIYFVSKPLLSASPLNNALPLGIATVSDFSLGNVYVVAMGDATAGLMTMRATSAGFGLVTDTAPFTFDTTDEIAGSFTYELS